MIPQRSIGDDKEDVKPKIIEGAAYLKLPTDFNVVSSNALSTMNASNATSKHNYSLPPQAAFQQPITLIGQSQQSQNKVIINPSHISTNLALATQSMSDKITIPTSNIKLNLVPSQLAQVMQSGGGLVIDAKSGTVTGDLSQASQQQTVMEQNVSGATTSTSAPNVSQIHYQQQQKVRLKFCKGNEGLLNGKKKFLLKKCCFFDLDTTAYGSNAYFIHKSEK